MNRIHALLNLLPAAILCLIPPCFAAVPADAQSHVVTYRRAGKALVEMALTKRIATEEVVRQVDVLLKEGVWVAEAYAKAHPSGAKLLKTVTDSIPAMKKLSFEDLEREWHDLHVFDGRKAEIGLDLSAEDAEHFTDPIHVIVHPLLVLKAAEAFARTGKAESLNHMKEEMEEGIEQVEKAVGGLGGK